MNKAIILEYLTTIMIWFSVWVIFELIYERVAHSTVKRLVLSTIMFFTALSFVFYRDHVLEFFNVKQ